jgi:hypothetical protein
MLITVCLHLFFGKITRNEASKLCIGFIKVNISEYFKENESK